MVGRHRWGKTFFVALKEGKAIRVGLDTNRGRVTVLTAQLELWLGDRWRPVVRYGTAHGHTHRDTLDWDGRVTDKKWLDPTRTYNEALQQAIDDLRQHADTYVSDFSERRPHHERDQDVDRGRRRRRRSKS